MFSVYSEFDHARKSTHGICWGWGLDRLAVLDEEL